MVSGYVWSHALIALNCTCCCVFTRIVAFASITAHFVKYILMTCYKSIPQHKLLFQYAQFMFIAFPSCYWIEEYIPSTEKSFLLRRDLATQLLTYPPYCSSQVRGIFLYFCSLCNNSGNITQCGLLRIFCGLSDWLMQVKTCRNFSKLLFCTSKFWSLSHSVLPLGSSKVKERYGYSKWLH